MEFTDAVKLDEAQYDVALFMKEVKGLVLPTTPTVPSHKIMALCGDLIREEADEFHYAQALLDYQRDRHPSKVGVDDLVRVADGLADLIYVCLYTANAYGIDMEPVWNEVQRTNMAKKGGPMSPTGKQLKPTGWEPPNIKAILEAQING